MLTLVKYSANWCGPCIKSQPIVWSVLQEFPKIRYVVVDVDTSEDRDEFKKYGTKTIPFFVLKKNDTVVWTHAGAVTKDYLRNVLARY